MNKPLDGKCMYVTMDPKVRPVLISMLDRKSGRKRDAGGDECSLQKVARMGIWNGNFGPEEYKEISLTELEALPDYVEPPSRKMTVADVSKMAGCQVEIIEG
ncbi:unnamed protein product [marine sediment metagenome]|uniref:Uncharacterized protein n=1 Tax=marine sediment metagenome TaxID=412755 RepID=X0VJ65_9ZZZZ